MKSFTDEMDRRMVSKRGPYDLFTGERNKPIAVGYFALPVRDDSQERVMMVRIASLFTEVISNFGKKN